MTEQYVGNKTDFYVASSKVADTVNLAIQLNRPILVEGEPGSGKTMLAYSIAAELGLNEPTKIIVKSTSHAQDLLYRINALRRLQDAQNPHAPQAQYIYPYLVLGPLGHQIHRNQRSVVLIDEIDKADIDFPNDLLDVLDTFTFQIDELPEDEEEACLREKGFGRLIATSASERPIVVITSNREKRLPEPFLRRCLYIKLTFPETVAELTEIVLKNIDEGVEQINQSILTTAIEAFQRVRIASIRAEAQKPPTTSELIDWVKILHWRGHKPEDLTENPYLPPYWELLFKNMHDLDLYEKNVRSAKT